MTEQQCPLKVYYPLGGRTFMLHWWTQDDRGHLVLSRTEKAVHEVAQHVFEKNPDAEIKVFSEINIVGPSEQLLALAAEHLRREKITHFHGEMMWRIREVAEEGETLPAPFAPCSGYEPQEPEESDDDQGRRDYNQSCRDKHYGCKHCQDKIQLVNMTPDELYARYHDAWERLHPIERHEDPRRVPSRAPPYDHGRPLWYAVADFGHHSSGIDLNKADFEQDYRPAFLSDRLMFLFERVRDLDTSRLSAMLDVERQASEKFFAEKQAQRISESAEAYQQRIREMIAFFKENQGELR